MREPRIGRLVIAALHQAIAEALPLRLEFYENWLKPLGLLKEGKHIGPAPFSAALSFLRREDVRPLRVDHGPGRRARRRVAHRHAALVGRRWARLLPDWWRARSALRAARRICRAAYPNTRVRYRVEAAAGARRDQAIGLLPGARDGRSAVVRLLRRPAAPAARGLRAGGDGTAREVPRDGQRGVRPDRDLAGRGDVEEAAA